MDLDNLVGQTLDEKYKIERELGRGGMGAVYLSTHVGTERPVAVKVIVPQFMQRAEFVERFRREARAAGRLRHPNVVDVTDFGFADTPDGRVAYLVMEYLDGCTLGEILEEEKQIPLEWTLDILEQVSSAIHEAHEQGIIHRDLKPDNIWLEPNPRGGYTVKVLDFGIAKLETAPHESRVSGLLDSQVDIPDRPKAQTTQAFNLNLTLSGDSQAQTVSENNGATVASDKQTIAEMSRPKTIFGEAGTLIQQPAAVIEEPPVDLEAGTAVFDLGREAAILDLEGGTAILDSESGTAIFPTAQGQTIKQGSEAGTKMISSAHANAPRPLLSKKSPSELTRVGAVLGTPLYMSPEQCRGERLTAQSDIYSLGVIAYQMLGGKTPFSGEFTEVMRSHKESLPPPLEVKKLRKKVKKVVMSALEKDTAKRPPTAESFASELRASSEGIGVLFQRALVIYTQYLPKFLLLSVLMYSPIAVITILQVINSFLSVSESISRITSIVLSVILALAAVFLGVLSGYLMFGTMTWLVTQIFAYPLRPVKLRPALNAVRKKWKSLLKTGLLSGALTSIGYVCFFVPGITLSIFFALAAPIVMMENVRGYAALKRSNQLVNRSLRTTIAAILIMFLVPVVMSGVSSFMIKQTVASFTSSGPPVVIRKEDKSTTAKPEEPKPNNPENPSQTPNRNDGDININLGKGDVVINNTNEPKKDMRRRVGESISEALMNIITLPLSILIASFSSIVVSLLFLKTRQAGGESMQDLLAQFEEEEQPHSEWQKRVRNRLIQSGRVTSRSDSMKHEKRTTEGS